MMTLMTSALKNQTRVMRKTSQQISFSKAKAKKDKAQEEADDKDWLKNLETASAIGDGKKAGAKSSVALMKAKMAQRFVLKELAKHLKNNPKGAYVLKAQKVMEESTRRLAQVDTSKPEGVVRKAIKLAVEAAHKAKNLLKASEPI